MRFLRANALALLALGLFGCAEGPIQRIEPVLRLTEAPVAVRIHEVDYLNVDGKTFRATVYQPEGVGPFPTILDVHGGAWVREDVDRNEHAAMDRALAAAGIVVVAIDYRQSAKHRYPESVADVNFAMRWVRANAEKFNGSPNRFGVFGSSSGGHLVLLNALRPLELKYAALPLSTAPATSAIADYLIVVYPISDPLARRAYAQERRNAAPVKFTDIYFAAVGSIEEGNPQLILDRRQAASLPPVLLLQGSADASGLVRDTNVSPEIQQRFADSYSALGGVIEVHLLPGFPHNFVNEPGPNLDQALSLMKRFIEKQLNK